MSRNNKKISKNGKQYYYYYNKDKIKNKKEERDDIILKFFQLGLTPKEIFETLPLKGYKTSLYIIKKTLLKYDNQSYN